MLESCRKGSLTRGVTSDYLNKKLSCIGSSQIFFTLRIRTYTYQFTSMGQNRAGDKVSACTFCNKYAATPRNKVLVYFTAMRASKIRQSKRCITMRTMLLNSTGVVNKSKYGDKEPRNNTGHEKQHPNCHIQAKESTKAYRGPDTHFNDTKKR